MWTVTFRNTSDHPIWVNGYSPGFPLYTILVRPSPDASWVERPVGWCGVGVGPQVIQPGVSHALPVYLPGELQGHEFVMSIPYWNAWPTMDWSTIDRFDARSDPRVIGRRQDGTKVLEPTPAQ
jgi:hypothetical protein